MNFVVMLSDKEVILLALQKERDDLHQRILQVDRIMNRVRSIEYYMDSPDNTLESPKQPVIALDSGNKEIAFPTSADIKIQVLRVFDIIGTASELAKIQQEYTNITGSNYKIREAVRSLHTSGIVKMLKFKNASRGFMWAKRDWIEAGELLDKHKPLGFDLLYSKENLVFV